MDGYYRFPYSALIYRCPVYLDNNISTVYARTVLSNFEDLNFTALNDSFNVWIRLLTTRVKFSQKNIGFARNKTRCVRKERHGEH